MRLILAVILVSLLSACASQRPLPSSDAPYFNWIQASTPESSLTGKIYFWPLEKGTAMKLTITGAVPEKKYFVYLHQIGACADEARAAGEVLTSPSSFFGFSKNNPALLAVIQSAPDGTAEFSSVFDKFAMQNGSLSIAGKSLVISEDEKAELRAGCAVIPVPQTAGKSAD